MIAHFALAHPYWYTAALVLALLGVERVSRWKGVVE